MFLFHYNLSPDKSLGISYLESDEAAPSTTTPSRLRAYLFFLLTALIEVLYASVEEFRFVDRISPSDIFLISDSGSIKSSF